MSIEHTEESSENEPLPTDPELARVLHGLIDQIDPGFISNYSQISANRQKERVIKGDPVETDWVTYSWYASVYREATDTGEDIFFTVSQEISNIVNIIPPFAEKAVAEYLAENPDDEVVFTCADSLDFEVNLTTGSIEPEYSTGIFANSVLVASIDTSVATWPDKLQTPPPIPEAEASLFEAFEADMVSGESEVDNPIRQLEVAIAYQDEAQRSRDNAFPLAIKIMTILGCMDFVSPAKKPDSEDLQ